MQSACHRLKYVAFPHMCKSATQILHIYIYMFTLCSKRSQQLHRSLDPLRYILTVSASRQRHETSGEPYHAKKAAEGPSTIQAGTDE